MDPIERHVYQPDVSFDGGDLDCGGGLLLLIRRHIDPMERGGLLEILSTDSTVEVELPAWCRMTKNEMVSWTKRNGQRSFLVCKGLMEERRATATLPPPASIGEQLRVKVTIPDSLPPPSPAPEHRAPCRSWASGAGPVPVGCSRRSTTGSKVA